MLTLEASVSIVLHEAMSAGLVGYTTATTTDPAGLAIDDNNNNNNNTTNYEGQKYHVERINKGGTSDTTVRERKRKEREDKMKELQDEADTKKQQSLFGDVNDGDY